MYSFLTSSLRTLNDLLTAGIAITAFSLLLYALSFNLRDRVARSFALILLNVVVVYVTDSLGSVFNSPDQLAFWMRAQWLGIVFLPAAYLHFSDAVLATTGRPSRGRRQMLVRIAYLASLAFLAALPFGLLVGPLVPDGQPVPHLQRTPLTLVFSLYYAAAMAFSWFNFWRAFQRTTARSSRRRMSYLIAGALAPALGSFPYLLFGSGFAARFPLTFWIVLTISNLAISALLVIMAYAVAFFGVPWPDRVVKRRLFKWLMRGPVTASTTLAVTTVVGRLGRSMGWNVLVAAQPAVTVFTILIMEHLITLTAPVMERLLFYGGDRSNITFLKTLEERLMTEGDLRQFLEVVLAAVADRLQANNAFVAGLGPQGVDLLIEIGGDNGLSEGSLPADMLEVVVETDEQETLFTWGDYWLVPLYEEDQGDLLGLLGVEHRSDEPPDEEQEEAMTILAERAAMALQDRYHQQQVFSSLAALSPQTELIQRLRAASRYDGTEVLATPGIPLEEKKLSEWVKDALSHYWGGPKLTESPLMGLSLVQEALDEHEGNPTNALRSILKKAVETTRPEGERRFTAEWILYNILELKFMEGRKVREVAKRLAMSEADLYRKQRVAIEAVASAIVEMENQAIAEKAKDRTEEQKSMELER